MLLTDIKYGFRNVLKIDNKVGVDRIVDISKKDYERIPKRLLFSQTMCRDNIFFVLYVNGGTIVPKRFSHNNCLWKLWEANENG